MKDCLVTRLKASVQDDSLEKIGYLTIKFATPKRSVTIGTYQIGSDPDTRLQMTLKGGLTFDTVGNAVKSNNDTVITTTADSATFKIANYGNEKYAYAEISNKYHIANLDYLVDVDTSKFKYMPSLTRLKVFENITGELTELITSCPNLTTITFNAIQTSYPKISGRFSDFGLLKNIEIIEISSCVNFVNSSIEDFVANQVHIGNASSSGNGVRLKFSSTPISYNSESVAGGATKYITWSANGGNTIITYDSVSVTIHVNSDGTWTRVS